MFKSFQLSLFLEMWKKAAPSSIFVTLEKKFKDVTWETFPKQKISFEAFSSSLQQLGSKLWQRLWWRFCKSSLAPERPRMRRVTSSEVQSKWLFVAPQLKFPVFKRLKSWSIQKDWIPQNGRRPVVLRFCLLKNPFLNLRKKSNFMNVLFIQKKPPLVRLGLNRFTWLTTIQLKWLAKYFCIIVRKT